MYAPRGALLVKDAGDRPSHLAPQMIILLLIIIIMIILIMVIIIMMIITMESILPSSLPSHLAPLAAQKGCCIISSKFHLGLITPPPYFCSPPQRLRAECYAPTECCIECYSVYLPGGQTGCIYRMCYAQSAY